MRKTVLATVAAFGVLAAGCTTGAPEATPSRAPTSAAEAEATNEMHTLADLIVGGTAWASSELAGDPGVCGTFDPTQVDTFPYKVGDLQSERSLWHWLIKHPNANTYSYVWFAHQPITEPTITATRKPGTHIFDTGIKCPSR